MPFYLRDKDKAVMVRIAPLMYVNAESAKKLELLSVEILRDLRAFMRTV